MNFYIPWEAYDIYGIKGDPFAYRIKLKVDGAEIQVSKDNYRSLLSKEIANTPDPAKVMESFEKLVAESSGYNDGVLVSLDKAPFSIQYYEYYSSGGSAIIPTYISEK